MESLMPHLMSHPSSPYSSALPSPPSSPGSSFSSFPSSAFSLSVPSSPPRHESPPPAQSLIIPSLSLDASEHSMSTTSHSVNPETLGQVNILLVGSRGSGKTFLAEALMHGNGEMFVAGDWKDEPGLGRTLLASKPGSEVPAYVRLVEHPGFDQSDDPYTILESVLNVVHTPFRSMLPLFSQTHPADATLRDLLASPNSRLYTAVLLLTSSPPTPLENSLLLALSLHLPVLPIPSQVFSHPPRARARPTRNRPRTTNHLRSIFFHRPAALRALRYEAADRFLRWRDVELEAHGRWDDMIRARTATRKGTPEHILDPLHVRSVVLMSLSLVRPLMESLRMRWWVISAFCAGFGVGWLLNAAIPGA